MTRRKTRGVRACTHQYSTGASAKRCVQARTLPQASRGTRARRGLVLVLVMVVIVMLSLAGLSFVALMSTENKAVYLRGDELQAECLLGSAEAAIQAMLELPPEKRQADGGLVDNADRFKGVLVLGDQRSKRRGRYAVFSPRVEDGRTTGIRFGLQNESARLNLTVLPDWERRKPGSARAALLKLPGMTEPIADATLDWIDADTTPRQSGAEADYYTSLAVPYAPRNAVPGCLEELLLVKGVTRELVFGADANFNGRIDPGESAGGNTAESVTGPPWASLVTLYSAESNLNPQGKPRVYLNQGDLRTLHGQLVKVLDADQAKFIILYRQFGPSNKEPPEQPKAGETLSSVQVNFGEQGTRRLASVLSLIGARVEVPGQGVKKAIVLRSPFSEETTAMSTYLPRLLDHTSVVRGRVIRGRVNVDLAPREVLEGIPGIDEATAGQIVAARGSRGSADNGSSRYATWLLTEGILGLEEMRALMPYVTTRGGVYRAQVAGFFDRSGPVTRAELVVDATGPLPRRVYWKDLRLFGLGYSRESLGGESREKTEQIEPSD